ncbi:zinc finger protein 532-like isoform X1 [Pomacea canaliculata]|uniref:zinc finger protein 532-like isoform X1 n=1 Tax=Pomacea canaliculata TaxID=400727 RepID=UPI000D72EA20|nr:zinc finger protein 532-like isoform X1 [Pomacea canaliculata]XP_025076595.1 zinc finger protein 532-like isoform X1 [Pomacea canaliculata]XP_025076596.1 zinc finger protein 532-like isoform X1 [Pomacea canaliculata]
MELIRKNAKSYLQKVHLPEWLLGFLKESLLQKKSMRDGDHYKRKCDGSSPSLRMSEEGATLGSFAEVKRPKAAMLASAVSNEHAEWLGNGKSKESALCSSGSTSSVVSKVFSDLPFAKRVLNGEENKLGDSGKHLGKKRKVGELPNQSPTSCGNIKRSDVTILSDVSRLIEKEKSGGFVNIGSVSDSSVPSCSTGNSGKQQTARKKVTKSSLNSKVGMMQASSKSQPLRILPRVLPAPAHADSNSSLMVVHVRDSNIANERKENTTISSAAMPTATFTTLGSVSALGTNSSAEHFLSICGHLVNMEDFKKLIDTNIKNVPQIIQVPLPDGTSRSFTVIFSPKIQTPETNHTTQEGITPGKPSPASSTNASSIPGNITLSHSVRSSLPSTFLLASLPLQTVVPAVSAPAATKTVTSQGTKHSAILPTIFSKSLSHPKGVPMSFSKKTTAQTSQFRKIQPRILRKAAPKQNGTMAPAAVSSNLEDSVAKDIESDVTIEDVSVLLQRTNPIATYIYDPGHQISHIQSCIECGDSFSTAAGYTSHMNRMSIVIRYACRFCSLAMAFFNKCAFMSHLRLHADAGQNEEDSAAFNPKSHTISVSSLPSFLLPAVGPHVFGPTVDDLNAPIDCSECGLSLQNADLLAVHFGANVQQCNFLHTCQFCDMELPSSCALKAHLRLHDNNRLVHARPHYVCPECGLSFPAQASLYQHLLSACVHFSRLVCLKCKICAEIFSSQYSMRCHLLQHHIEEADHEEEHVSARYIFACNLCKDVVCHFPTKDCLRKHFSSIQNCYRYKCVICSAGFILLSELCQHINMRHSLHSGPSEQENTNSTKFRPDACLPFNMWQVVRQSSIDVTVSKLLDVRFTPGDEDSYRVLNIWKSFRKKTKSPKNIRVDAFFCPFCGFTPSSIALIKQHLNYHRVWNKPVCQICWRGHFFTKVDFQYHSELHTSKRTSNMRRQNGISQEDSTISEASSSLVKILSSNPILDTSQPAVLSHSSSKSDESSSSSSLCDNVSLSSDDDEEEEDGECAGRRLLKLPPLLFDHDSEDQSSSKPFHTCHLCGLTYRSQEMLRNHYSHAHIGHKNVFVCLVCRKRKKERPFPKKDLLVKHCIRKHRLSAKEAERMVSKEAIQPLMLMPGELFPVPGQQQQSQNSAARSSAGSRETAPVKRLRVTGDTRQDFICAKCSFSTGIMAEFRSHIITHTVSNCVQCLECGLSFSVLTSLKKHLFMVHRILQPDRYVEENQIRMTEPSEEVSTHLNLFQSFHQKELHNLNPEMFHEAMDRPEVTEPQKSENPLECTVCYRGFECESQLKTHMRTHGMAFIRSRRTRKKEHNSRNEEETKVSEALADSKVTI